MCGKNIHLWVQDILETGVQFYGYKNNPNLKTVLAIRNTQLRQEQVIISSIGCKKTESLPQVGNDETKKNENMIAM